MWDYFWYTVENIPEGMGYSLISFGHLFELAVTAFVTWALTKKYKAADSATRKKIRKWIVILLWVDEAFKHIGLLMYGNWMLKYLPLHLCSINIFFITYHYFTDDKLVGNFLWALCIPAAFLALMFTSWSALPMLNFMHIHSVTVHILLFVYPILLVAGGDVKRDIRMLPKEMLMAGAMALPIYFLNKLWETNFMFLAQTDNISILVVLEKIFGSHLIGILLLMPIVMSLMYLPWKFKKKAVK